MSTGTTRNIQPKIASVLIPPISRRALYFGIYDSMKEKMGKTNILAKFAMAQAVATVSVTVSYPFDTVRRRLMMMSGE